MHPLARFGLPTISNWSSERAGSIHTLSLSEQAFGGRRIDPNDGRALLIGRNDCDSTNMRTMAENQLQSISRLDTVHYETGGK
ncbi:hypothetical protein GCM10023156_56770 [Novipirellula rosea]|uniref:Uncharacterized protein n=1 Tax=Novipirellula rosea TaxID=1031540 RepID=A0ABP8NIT2_9BACT